MGEEIGDDGCGLCDGWRKRWTEDPEGTELPPECPDCGRDLRIPLAWIDEALGREPREVEENVVWTLNRMEIRPLDAQEIEPGVTVRFVTGRFAGRVGTVLGSLSPDRIQVELREAVSGA